MTIEDKLSGNKLSLIVKGHITGISEFNELKQVIDSSSQVSTVELSFRDAYVIPSILIGYLVKIINLDKKTVIIKCSQKELKSLLTDLNLHTVMNVR